VNKQLAKALRNYPKILGKRRKTISVKEILLMKMGLIQQEINPLINKLIDVGILEKGQSVTASN
jgi:hypothetical protein